MTRSLIIGIGGMDGSYLAEHLLSYGHEIHGMVRRNSTPEHQSTRLDGIQHRIKLHYGDVTDPASCHRIVWDTQPDEIYNLAGQSHVRISSDVPHYTAQTNAIGVLNMLDAMKTHAPAARFYQASSSEQFGNEIDDDGYQRITTHMRPVSPYGCAKLYGYMITRHFREAYGLHCCNGVLFNHESPRRGANFVTAKIIKTAVEIKHGISEKLVLGNLDSKRDWGDSRDYVRAMRLIVQHEEPGDWVVATGKTRSVRDLCELVFDDMGLGDYRKYVVQDERFMRPGELHMLRGDALPIEDQLGWRRDWDFDKTIGSIIERYLYPNTDAA